MAVPDRIALLRAQSAITGLDFVSVAPDQLALDLHFLVPPPAALMAELTTAMLLLRPDPDEDGAPRPAITLLAWEGPADHRHLAIQVSEPGGFGNYRLGIDHPRVDPYFNNLVFSFKANCDSDLDCATPEPECPPEDEPPPVIDYLERDYHGLRRSLLAFAGQRYPDWQDRLAADVGVMLVEAMSALGDEFAYTQDRIAREGHFESATQRRSLRHHARLVDYEPHDGLAARGWVEVTVDGAVAGSIAAGADLWAEGDDGRRIAFEIGQGLAETLAGRTYAVDPGINRLEPHVWDEAATCLDAGAGAVLVKGHWQAALPLFELDAEGEPFRWLLLRTDPADPALPARRWLVRLRRVEEFEDPLVAHPVFGNAVSRLAWSQAEATPWQLDLESLSVRGNILPATAGRTFDARIVAGADPATLGLPEAEQALLRRTVERIGPDGSTLHRAALPLSAETPLCWLGPTPEGAAPELAVEEIVWDGADWQHAADWIWRRSLAGATASLPDDRHVTLEDGQWRRIVGYERNGAEIVHEDYAGQQGVTLRFGDGRFGLTPAAGTVFRIRYRLGNGRLGNVAAGSLRHFDPAGADVPVAVDNPLAAEDGLDAETPEVVRQLAPEAFRHDVRRAVRPEDYAAAAERLDWVDRAGARARWTGSWLTTQVTPDPRDASVLSTARRHSLDQWLDRFRQAGREVRVASPRYADIDLEIAVCAAPDAYPAEVARRVSDALLGRAGRRGFFHPDNFTFGTPLYRSRLEAAVQAVPGVRALEDIRIRRRGVFDWTPLTGPYLPLGDNEIIRLENDPDRPERGTLSIRMEGGA